MKNILILIGSCYHNMGSEALVRGTVSIIKKHIPESRIILSGSEEQFGSQLNYPDVDEYVRRFSFYGGISVKRFLHILIAKILKLKDTADKIKYSGLIKAGRSADLIVVIGGDNYDKTYTSFAYMHEVNRILRRESKAKMVMYDCSLAPEEINKDIIKDFSMFDAITARESITYEAFCEHFPKEKIYFFPDPAFVMEAKAVELPDGLIQDKTVGVNLSNLVLGKQYGDKAELVIMSYVNLIKYILERTDLNVLLIPHVMQGKDLSALQTVYNRFSDTPRISLVSNESYNATELKYLISKFRLFIGARTHSTIAAYSTSVPTLVLGYSVKSKGIARDIFGNYEEYVVHLSEIKTTSDLAESFVNLYHKEDLIRDHLKSFMPEYIVKSNNAGNLFESLINRG